MCEDKTYTVEEMVSIFNRVLDVESKIIADKEGRDYETVRAESYLTIHDEAVFVHTSKAILDKMKQVIEKDKDDNT